MGSHHREQLDQVLTHGVAIVPRAHPDDVDETDEGIFDVAPEHVKVGHQHLRGEVGGRLSRRRSSSLLVDAGSAHA